MAYGARILIVEDDVSVSSMLVEYLTNHRYEVKAVADGAAMRAAIEAQLPDLVLMDIHLPGEDGLSLARSLRTHYDIAIIMVTAAGNVIDRVVGLEVGADDYVAKPFDPRELLSRIKSVLRRTLASQAKEGAAASASPPAETSRRVRFGRCWFEPEARRLSDSDGAEVAMTAMEYELIRAFLANPNRVLSRDQLLQQSRNRDWEPFDRSIDIRIGRLRRKVEMDGGEPRTIRTVRGGGYMYVPEGVEPATLA